MNKTISISRFLSISILCSFSYLLPAQTLKSYIKVAEQAVDEQDFYAAQVYLAKALAIEPYSSKLLFDYGLILYNFNSIKKSKENFGKVLENKDILEYPETYFWLGMCEKKTANYSEAISYFQKYMQLKSTKKSKKHLEIAKKELKTCLWAKNLPAIDTIEIQQLGKSINTSYSEFAPYGYGDTLYYSSYKFSWKNDKHEPQRKLTKVLTSYKNAKGRTMRSNFNIPEKHTAHTTFSSDGNRIYFTICEFVNSAKINCQLYFREKDRRGRWQKKATPLPEFINSDKYTSTQPTVAFDSLRNSEVIIFSSDRPGGKGKNDLWLSEIKGSKFSKPENLTELNTPEDELTPFFHQQNQQLWFSSDGLPGLGGYDIYYAKKEGDKWGKARHAGKPINSSFNDIYFNLNSNNKNAYLSSNRVGSYFLDKENKNCCNDIYEVNFIAKVKDTQERPTTTPPITRDTPPLPTKPKEPTSLQDFLPLALYFDNDEPDRRTRRTTTKKNYSETFESYYSRRREYIQAYAAPLEEDERYEAENNMENFFTDRVSKGHRYLFLFSDILLKRLTAGENVEIFVKGYTSPRAKSDYNINLGKRRISSIRNHFAEYADRIFSEYLASGQLTITERSFGETFASNQISDDLDDLRNSVYSIDAAKERRVEIVEIKVD